MSVTGPVPPVTVGRTSQIPLTQIGPAILRDDHQYHYRERYRRNEHLHQKIHHLRLRRGSAFDPVTAVAEIPASDARSCFNPVAPVTDGCRCAGHANGEWYARMTSFGDLEQDAARHAVEHQCVVFSRPPARKKTVRDAYTAAPSRSSTSHPIPSAHSAACRSARASLPTCAVCHESGNSRDPARAQARRH
jgi:hypothetical protein